ncbi:40S ribosomal protein S13, partial [Tanacetum coccineum]
MPIDDECSSHNSPAADEGEQLDSIKRSNKTVESPSDVLGKRKRTDEGDGAAAASKIIPWQLHDWKYDPATASTYVSAKVDISTPKKKRRVLLKEVLLELEEDGKGYTDSESESASEDKNDSESEVASEDKNGSESESVNNHYVKNLLKDKNDTESEGGLDSIEGSNKTVESPSSDVLGKRKRTDEGDGAAASKIIPRQLHLLILEALELRQDMMQNKLQCEVKNDSESELDSYRAAALDKCEDRIRSLVKSFKKLKQLPHDWEYDPDTASTFVSAEADISTLPKMPPPKEKRMYFHYEINREVKKAVKGKNYTQLMKDLEYKIDGESESDNNHDVKNLLKDKNDTELKKDLEYKNDSESERVWNNCLDSINGSNNTVESPSAVLGKRKRTDEGDGDATSKIIPWELHLRIQDALEFRAEVMLYKLEAKKALTGNNYSESELVSEDKNDSESDSDDDLDFQLKQCEDRIRSLAKRFKKLKQLPHDWEYDPATASTFVAAEDDISALPKMPPPKEKRLGCCSWVMDPNKKFPKTTDVPLDEEEKKIWKDFKEFDKDKV